MPQKEGYSNYCIYFCGLWINFTILILKLLLKRQIAFNNNFSIASCSNQQAIKQTEIKTGIYC